MKNKIEELEITLNLFEKQLRKEQDKQIKIQLFILVSIIAIFYLLCLFFI